MVLPGARSCRVLSNAGVNTRTSKAHCSRVLKSCPVMKGKSTVMKALSCGTTVKALNSQVMKRVLPVEIKKVLPMKMRVVSTLTKVETEGAGSRAQRNKMTILEQKSISTEVRHQYQNFLLKFENFCRDSGLKWPLVKIVDAILADYLDVVFLDNRSAAEGEKL